MSSKVQSDYPHLTEEEWYALQRMQVSVGEETMDLLLKQGTPAAQSDAARRFIATEITIQQQQTQLQHLLARQAQQEASAPRLPSLKMDVTIYKGGESESLPRWFVEVETAIFARQLHDAQLQVAFGMSKLGGLAKSWAFGKRLADPKCFPTFKSFKEELEDAFQPPKCEFRQRARFLAIKQGKRDLHDYVQEARYLVASIVQNPVDDATQVSVFLNGLAEGPVRTQMFREYPDDLEEAITKSLQEDFSQKQAKADGIYIRRARPSSGPEPMDLSYAEAVRKNNPQPRKQFSGQHKKAMTCHRCNRQGHLAYECRAPAPLGRNSKSRNDNRFARRPKNGQTQ